MKHQGTVTFVVIVLFILGLGYWFYWDHVDMKKHNCQRTDESRLRMVWINTYDGKGNITGGYPTMVTDWLYVCDDHARWR